jgi:hypothetical protein
MAKKLARTRRKRQRATVTRTPLELFVGGEGGSGLLWVLAADGRWYSFEDDPEAFDESVLIEVTTEQIIDAYERELRSDRTRRIAPAQKKRRELAAKAALEALALRPEVERLRSEGKSQSAIARILSTKNGHPVGRKVVRRILRGILN